MEDNLRRGSLGVVHGDFSPTPFTVLLPITGGMVYLAYR